MGVVLISVAGTLENVEHDLETNQREYLIVVSSVLFSAVLIAIMTIVTKRLREIHYSVVQFHFSFLACCVTGLIDLVILSFTI